MFNVIPPITLAGYLFTAAAPASAGTVYANSFDSTASLDGFTTLGSPAPIVVSGQLVLAPSDLDYQGVSADMRTAAVGLSPLLGTNPGLVSWSFNVSNMDGRFDRNNSFVVVLASNNRDPFLLESVGYAFSGGGFVENRMMLTQFNRSLGGNANIMVDIDSSVGLGTLPRMGSYRITFNPSDGIWSVYGQTGSSYVDPTTVTTLLGTSGDSDYTNRSLPYFGLIGTNLGKAYFDNMSIAVVPEPAAGLLAAAGLVTLTGRRRNQSGFLS